MMLMLAAGVADAAVQQVDVCQREGNGSYHLITIASQAVKAHLAKGGLLPGDPIPSRPGYKVNDVCAVVQASSACIIIDTVQNSSYCGYPTASAPCLDFSVEVPGGATSVSCIPAGTDGSCPAGYVVNETEFGNCIPDAAPLQPFGATCNPNLGNDYAAASGSCVRNPSDPSPLGPGFEYRYECRKDDDAFVFGGTISYSCQVR